MNCLDFRRMCLADPDAAIRHCAGHLAQCPDCAAYARQVRETDDTLRRALAVDVPEELRARIRLKQAIEAERSDPFRRRWLASAALLLVAITAGVFFGVPTVKMASNAEAFHAAAITYMQQRPELLAVEQNVTADELDSMIGNFGGRLVAQPGRVRVAELCRVRDQRAAHLVLDGERGPVSVIFARDVDAGGRRITRTHDGDYASLLAPAGPGTVVLMGERDEPLERTLDRLGESIAW